MSQKTQLQCNFYTFRASLMRLKSCLIWRAKELETGTKSPKKLLFSTAEQSFSRMDKVHR